MGRCVPRNRNPFLKAHTCKSTIRSTWAQCKVGWTLGAFTMTVLDLTKSFNYNDFILRNTGLIFWFVEFVIPEFCSWNLWTKQHTYNFTEHSSLILDVLSSRQLNTYFLSIIYKLGSPSRSKHYLSNWFDLQPWQWCFILFVHWWDTNNTGVLYWSFYNNTCVFSTISYIVSYLYNIVFVFTILLNEPF